MEDILKPVLNEESENRQIYSSRANFFVGFIGGPLALIGFSFLNSRLLNRGKKDFPFYVLGIIIYFVALSLIPVYDASAGKEIYYWLADLRRSNPAFRYGFKVLALSLWALYFFASSQLS